MEGMSSPCARCIRLHEESVSYLFGRHGSLLSIDEGFQVYREALTCFAANFTPSLLI